MISKELLLSKLKKGQIAEEKAIPIYTKHLSSAIFWTGIDKECQDDVRNILKRLADESRGHKEILRSTIEKINKDERNAF